MLAFRYHAVCDPILSIFVNESLPPSKTDKPDEKLLSDSPSAFRLSDDCLINGTKNTILIPVLLRVDLAPFSVQNNNSLNLSSILKKTQLWLVYQRLSKKNQAKKYRHPLCIATSLGWAFPTKKITSCCRKKFQKATHLPKGCSTNQEAVAQIDPQKLVFLDEAGMRQG